MWRTDDWELRSRSAVSGMVGRTQPTLSISPEEVSGQLLPPVQNVSSVWAWLRNRSCSWSAIGPSSPVLSGTLILVRG